ncbi:hypothetical protein EG68_09624 [Paragonimus skrjabini miyazakii]|uniref:Apple domain-containing protein n=1 Tax=Paragonimus skrjabini miyazakii TaxID=59628 RepID=A0A8S9YK39_9TREM|nr:hypothetical protein EG68_09624 [Paragonimus skrjabini miyazakii]
MKMVIDQYNEMTTSETSKQKPQVRYAFLDIFHHILKTFHGGKQQRSVSSITEENPQTSARMNETNEKVKRKNYIMNNTISNGDEGGKTQFTLEKFKINHEAPHRVGVMREKLSRSAAKLQCAFSCQTDEKCKHWWYNSEEKSCRLTYDDNINDPWHPDHRMESDKAFVSNSYTPDNLSA